MQVGGVGGRLAAGDSYAVCAAGGYIRGRSLATEHHFSSKLLVGSVDNNFIMNTKVQTYIYTDYFWSLLFKECP